MIETGWSGVPDELPVSQHLRTLAEVLAEQPSTRQQRDADRRERAEVQAHQDRVADAASLAASQAFMMRMNGTAPRDVLAEASRDGGLDREHFARRRAAIEILRKHDLADQIAGYQSGAVFDPNIGILEPVQDVSARADMDLAYESQRSQRAAEERTRQVEQFRAQMLGKMRERGMSLPGESARHESQRSAVPSAEDVYRRACAEIGCPVDGAAGDRIRSGGPVLSVR